MDATLFIAEVWRMAKPGMRFWAWRKMKTVFKFLSFLRQRRKSAWLAKGHHTLIIRSGASYSSQLRIEYFLAYLKGTLG